MCYLRAEGSDLQVIALYTDPDREAPFVRHADMAYRLPVKTTPVAAYLDHDLLLATLKQLGADAVWPWCQRARIGERARPRQEAAGASVPLSDASAACPRALA